ncbi:MAG: hypothetical protein Gyms2KO_43440 [Gymnodinialimonas sp.]
MGPQPQHMGKPLGGHLPVAHFHMDMIDFQNPHGPSEYDTGPPGKACSGGGPRHLRTHSL